MHSPRYGNSGIPTRDISTLPERERMEIRAAKILDVPERRPFLAPRPGPKGQDRTDVTKR